MTGPSSTSADAGEPVPAASGRIEATSLAPLVEIRRGARVESLHLGAVAIADGDGRIVAACGDARLTTYLRSTAKPFQLLAMVASGAAAHFGFSDEELAVMAASHGGRDEHVAAVRRALGRIDLGEGALQCGAHAPADASAREALAHRGAAPSPLHNNCSGKHAAMLALARFGGYRLDDYLDPDHEVQRAIRATLAELGGVAPQAIAVAVDGCSAPCFAMPLSASARAFARLADAARQDEDAREPAPLARIARAMSRHPAMVAGPGRLDTTLIEATGGAVLAKSGAEGYQGLALRERGLGVAFKLADGGARAAGPLAVALLRELGVLDGLPPAAARALDALRVTELTNHRGLSVGEIRPVPELRGATATPPVP